MGIESPNIHCSPSNNREREWCVRWAAYDNDAILYYCEQDCQMCPKIWTGKFWWTAHSFTGIPMFFTERVLYRNSLVIILYCMLWRVIICRQMNALVSQCKYFWPTRTLTTGIIVELVLQIGLVVINWFSNYDVYSIQTSQKLTCILKYRLFRPLGLQLPLEMILIFLSLLIFLIQNSFEPLE